MEEVAGPADPGAERVFDREPDFRADFGTPLSLFGVSRWHAGLEWAEAWRIDPIGSEETLGKLPSGTDSCEIWIDETGLRAHPLVPHPDSTNDESFDQLRELLGEWASDRGIDNVVWGDSLPRRLPANKSIDVEVRKVSPPLYTYLIRGGISSWRPLDGGPPAEDEWWHANVQVRPGWRASHFDPRSLPGSWRGSFGEIELRDGHYLIRPVWRPPFKADGEIDLHYDLARTLGPWAELNARPLLIGDHASHYLPGKRVSADMFGAKSKWAYGCPKCGGNIALRFNGLGRNPAAIRTRCPECGSEFAKWRRDAD